MTASERPPTALAGKETDLSTRPAGPADRKAILDLLGTSLGGDGLLWNDEAHWLWKHERNPFGGSACRVAEANGRVVALRTFMRWTWQSAGKAVHAVRAVDTATHPDVRRLGLFRRLTLELIEAEAAAGTSFVFNTPNDQSRPGYLTMGWRLVGRVPLWIKPIRPVRALMRVARSRLAAAPESVRPDVRPEGIGALLADPTLPAVLERAENGDPRYHTRRTPTYLRWRYAEVPGLSYSAVWRFDDGAGAIAIYRDRERHGLRERMLCETIVTPDRAGVALARRVLRRAASIEGADYIVACAARRTPERAALIRCGFIPFGGWGPHFACRELAYAADLLDITEWSNWRCGIGDLELF